MKGQTRGPDREERGVRSQGGIYMVTAWDSTKVEQRRRGAGRKQTDLSYHGSLPKGKEQTHRP